MAEVNRTNRGRRVAAEAANNRRRKKRRRGKRTLHYILLTIFFLALGATLSLTVFFKIDSVTVIGVDKYPPDEIIAASGIEIGDNLFRIDKTTVKSKLKEQFPYLDTVKLNLKMPHGIQIEATQCTPAGAVEDGDEFLMITREGKVLEKGILLIPENIPLILGVNTYGATPGKKLSDYDKDSKDSEAENAAKEAEAAMTMLDYLLDAADATGFADITNVDLTDVYNMKIIYENRLLLNLGTEAELTEKLNFIKELIDNRLDENVEGIIDAGNISRSLLFTEMPIEDAKNGKKRSDKKIAAESKLDKPTESSKLDESSSQSSS